MEPTTKERLFKLGVTIVAFATLTTVCGCCGTFNRYLGLKDDNTLEEGAEYLLKEKTGIDIDLSPASPEGNVNLSP